MEDSLREWLSSGKQGYTSLPIYKRTLTGTRAIVLPRSGIAWKAASAHACLLESGKVGRYTYL